MLELSKNYEPGISKMKNWYFCHVKARLTQRILPASPGSRSLQIHRDCTEDKTMHKILFASYTHKKIYHNPTAKEIY